MLKGRAFKFGDGISTDHIIPGRYAHLRSNLAELAKQFKSADIKVRTELPIGKPAKEIIKYDAQSDSRVIIMSTHGRSGISRWAYGSVAENVMLGTQTPVIMVSQQ